MRLFYFVVLITVSLGATTLQATTWTSPAVVNPNASSETRDDNTPAIATDGSGNWVTVWATNQTPGLEVDIYGSRSTNNGVTWSAPAFVNSDSATDAGQDFTAALTYGQGAFIAFWSANAKNGSDSDIYFARSTNAGTTWTAIAALNDYATTDGATINDYFPDAASDGKGNWVVVWQAQNIKGPGQFLAVARSSNNGVSWATAKLLSNSAMTTTGLGVIPRIATDGNGTWIATAYSDNITSPSTGGDFEILSWRSTDNGATWTGPTPINTTATSDATTANDSYMDIQSNGHGTWICAWNSTYFTASDVDAVFARSTDNGLTWSAPLPLNDDYTTDVRFDSQPFVSSDQHGSWIIAWHSQTGDGDIYYVQSADDGSTWSSFQYLNTNGPSDTGVDQLVKLANDQKGKWIATWNSNNSIGGSGTDNEIQFASTNYANPWLHYTGAPASFGTMHVDSGATGTLAVVLQNDGLTSLTFSGPGYQITGPAASDFAITNFASSGDLAPGTSRTVLLNFNPSVAGARAAQLLVTTNDPSQPLIAVPLSGIGADQHAVGTDTTLHQFGQQLVSGGATTTQSIFVQNTGLFSNLGFTGAGIALTGADAAEYQIVNSPSTGPVAPSALREVKVVFDPSSTGIKYANLTFTTDDPNSPTINVPLSGVGINGPTAAQEWSFFE